MQKVPYQLCLPDERSTSVVFASPHSGRNYSWSFLRKTQLDELAIRTSEDAFVDRLFEDAPLFGAPFLAATTPRAYVDLNRSSEELDPALIQGAARHAHNPRVASGLGVIPRVVAGGRDDLSRQDINERGARAPRQSLAPISRHASASF